VLRLRIKNDCVGKRFQIVAIINMAIFSFLFYLPSSEGLGRLKVKLYLIQKGTIIKTNYLQSTLTKNIWQNRNRFSSNVCAIMWGLLASRVNQQIE